MVTVQVGLLSGRAVALDAEQDEEVASFKHRAQTALGVGRGRLLNSSSDVLDGYASLSTAGVKNGDLLTWLLTQETQVVCNHKPEPDEVCAFAAILDDGSVVTWGDLDYGGDSTAVQDELRNVQQIQASDHAFAAILADGSVVTWGDPDRGGDSTAVQDELRNVQQIQASHRAFAAVLADGSVVTWGHPEYGGDSTAVQDELKNVQQVQASDGAFAAILADGSVVTWGDPDYGGDSTAVQDELKQRAANPSITLCICCHSCRWLRRDLGRSGVWW